MPFAISMAMTKKELVELFVVDEKAVVIPIVLMLKLFLMMILMDAH